MSERATPFYCPYCGDEDLRPHEDGSWLCGACRRVFSVELLGLNFPEGVG
ncbi:MAG: Insertion element protein [Pseudonocardiaceae bacterium]